MKRKKEREWEDRLLSTKSKGWGNWKYIPQAIELGVKEYYSYIKYTMSWSAP